MCRVLRSTGCLTTGLSGLSRQSLYSTICQLRRENNRLKTDLLKFQLLSQKYDKCLNSEPSKKATDKQSIHRLAQQQKQIHDFTATNDKRCVISLQCLPYNPIGDTDSEQKSDPKSDLKSDTKRSAEKRYTCRWNGCGKTYTANNHLRRHQILHSGHTYRCVKGCDQTFPSPYYLKRHVMRLHSQYECNNTGAITRIRSRSTPISPLTPRTRPPLTQSDGHISDSEPNDTPNSRELRSKIVKEKVKSTDEKTAANKTANKRSLIKSNKKASDKTADKTVDNTVEELVAKTPVKKPIERMANKLINKKGDKTAEKAVDKTPDKKANKLVNKKASDKKGDKTVEKLVDKTPDKKANKSVDKPLSGSKSVGKKSVAKEFQCQWFGCEKYFTNRLHLQLHMKSHSQVVGHRCPDGCPGVFRTPGHLRMHQTGHHLRYRCDRDDCGYATANELALRSHQIGHQMTDTFVAPPPQRLVISDLIDAQNEVIIAGSDYF